MTEKYENKMWQSKKKENTLEMHQQKAIEMVHKKALSIATIWTAGLHWDHYYKVIRPAINCARLFRNIVLQYIFNTQFWQ